jgi:uncharacterized protein (DUF924 family)
MNEATPPHPRPDEVVTFWKEAGPAAWFRKDEAFDRAFRERFLAAHEAAVAGELDGWLEQPASALALVLLLDQFPRNAFRNTPRMFESDAQGRRAAARAIEQGFDGQVEEELRPFFYLPFEHSEDPADQERAVSLTEPIGGETHRYALLHRDIIRRFGRFPHRNAIVGRPSTDAELAFLAAGGFAG